MDSLKKILKLPGQPAVYTIMNALDECPNTSRVSSGWNYYSNTMQMSGYRVCLG
jgi:hypothetical protein